MSIRPSVKTVALFAGLGAAGLLGVGVVPATVPMAQAAPAAKPVISDEAAAAVAQMGKSLQADQFSFQARTLRVYADPGGEPLHIAHSMKVTVHRPDHLAVDLTGDDGSTKLLYDGKKAVLYSADAKKYASVDVPNTLQAMLETLTGKLGIDFPLADFLTDDPGKSFLFGITSGKEVGTATIGGVVCRHLFFTQSQGIELELWVEKNDKALPRRLIVTYRSLRDQPNFVAEFSDWDFSIHPADQEFVFTPPEGATQVPLKPAPTPAAAKK